MTAAKVRRKRAAIEGVLTKARTALGTLQAECPHHTPEYRYRVSSGNYDPSADSYWMEWSCPDCNMRWQTGQSRDEVRKFPGSVDVTRR